MIWLTTILPPMKQIKEFDPQPGLQLFVVQSWLRKYRKGSVHNKTTCGPPWHIAVQQWPLHLQKHYYKASTGWANQLPLMNGFSDETVAAEAWKQLSVLLVCSTQILKSTTLIFCLSLWSQLCDVLATWLYPNSRPVSVGISSCDHWRIDMFLFALISGQPHFITLYVSYDMHIYRTWVQKIVIDFFLLLLCTCIFKLHCVVYTVHGKTSNSLNWFCACSFLTVCHYSLQMSTIRAIQVVGPLYCSIKPMFCAYLNVSKASKYRTEFTSQNAPHFLSFVKSM